MMKKIKVIQLSHTSHSYFTSNKDNIEDIILNDWYSKTGEQTKRYFPSLKIECWSPEKIYKTNKIFLRNGVLYRFFPVTFSPKYGLDFSIRMLKEMKKEIKLAEEKGYKLIFHLHEYHNLHGLAIATIFKGEKIIAQHHGGSWPIKHMKENKRYRLFFIPFLLGQIWENKVLKNINCFYALSEPEIAYLKKKAPHSKIVFQTIGIDEKYFESLNKKIARKKLGLRMKDKIVLYIGRINETKGIRYLLETGKKLKDIKIKIIGFGLEKEKFEKQAKKEGLENIEFLGGVFGEKKILYLSAADIFVLPSSKEGASVSVMEAMARNLPIITTDVGGMPLMVENGKEGIIIRQKNSEDIVNAVKEILKWKKKDIRKYANKYKWKKIIENTVKDYENV